MFGLLATFALAAITTSPAQALPSVQALPPSCDRNTTILGGDTCNALCAREHVSTFQLRLVNPWINEPCTNLYATDVICLGITGQDCTDTYVVQPDDTCSIIEAKFDIPPSTLLSNNKNIDSQCSNLYYDQVLCVSGTVYPYQSYQ